MPIVWIGFAIFMLLCKGFTTQFVSIWFSARFMFTYLSDIDETAQAKVGAEIWTVKPDKAPHSKGTKSKATVLT